MNSQIFTPYQYSIIRYHHDATTHEFLNIGVAIYSPTSNYFRAEITNRFSRITCAFFNAKGADYKNYAQKIIRRFEALSEELVAPQLDLFNKAPDNIEKLLRRYVRKDSSFRYSEPASGIAPGPPEVLDQTFEMLFAEYVEKYATKDERESRSEQQVWKSSFRPQIERANPLILANLEPVKVSTRFEPLEYDYSYVNGQRHVIELLSFDLMNAYYIQRKARTTLGKNVLLNSSSEVSHLYLLLGKPIEKPLEVEQSYQRAKSIVVADDFNYQIQIIEEDEAYDFAVYLEDSMTRAGHNLIPQEQAQE